MDNQPYSKREQDNFFSQITNNLAEQKEILERIEQQTTTTNGRVNKLEIEKDILKEEVKSLSKTRDVVTRWGGAIALGAFLLGLAPFVYQLLRELQKPDKLTTTISEDTAQVFVEGIREILKEQAKY